MFKEITSPSNPIIKELVKIKTDTRFRNSGGVVLIEGEKLIKDISARIPLMCLIATDEKWLTAFKAKESYLVNEDVLKKVAATETPEGVIALVEMPEFKLPQLLNRLLVLDRLQDPGNVGTLIRTAYALSWDAVFLLNGSADPFNDKAIRAAKGGTFLIPLMKGDAETLKKVIKEHSLTTIGADMQGEPISGKFPEKMALILGNEGQGINEELKKEARLISIPIREGLESLNVASTGAILMYEFKK